VNRRVPRGYLLLVIGHIVSTFGSSIYLIALVVYLAEVKDSAAIVGSVQFVAYLPAALFGPVAGALVDRWDRKRIVVWTDLVRGLAMLAAAASSLILGTIPLAIVFAVTVIVSASGVLFVPAVHSLVPDLVPSGRLKQANALRSAATQVANLAGSAMGAALYVMLGVPALFALNGASFFVSGLSELPIRPVRHERVGRLSIRSSISDGFRVLKTHRGVRSIVVMQAVTNLLLPPIVVSLPFVLRDIWHLPETYFGFYFATVLAGGVLAFGLISLGSATRRGEALAYRAALPVITGFMLALAVFTLPAIAPSYPVRWLLFPLFLVAGAAIGTIHLVGVTRIQQVVAPSNRGRVFAASETATAALLPVVYLLSGIAAEFLREVPFALYSGVAVVAGVAAIGSVRSKALTSTLADNETIAGVRSPGHRRS
jgi:MFS family permease